MFRSILFYYLITGLFSKKLNIFLKIIEHQNKMDQVNARIKNELCQNTLDELSDMNLMKEYENSYSVKKQIGKLSNVIAKYVDNPEINDKIVKDFMLELVPAGTKGVIRGNRFNKIVKNHILEMDLDSTKYDVCFEKKYEEHETTEIPDAYIMDKTTKKILIIMNQLDLWQGGQQLNRGYKYLMDNKHNNENSKLLCVICNDIQFRTTNTKAYKLFEMGFQNNTLCYLKNLKNIISHWFH